MTALGLASEKLGSSLGPLESIVINRAFDNYGCLRRNTSTRKGRASCSLKFFPFQIVFKHYLRTTFHWETFVRVSSRGTFNCRTVVVATQGGQEVWNPTIGIEGYDLEENRRAYSSFEVCPRTWGVIFGGHALFRDVRNLCGSLDHTHTTWGECHDKIRNKTSYLIYLHILRRFNSAPWSILRRQTQGADTTTYPKREREIGWQPHSYDLRKSHDRIENES
jgi:hypothetical protein